MKTRIEIIIDGGAVQRVLIDGKPGEFEVFVKDYDCEGAEPEDVLTDSYGQDRFFDQVFVEPLDEKDLADFNFLKDSE